MRRRICMEIRRRTKQWDSRTQLRSAWPEPSEWRKLILKWFIALSFLTVENSIGGGHADFCFFISSTKRSHRWRRCLIVTKSTMCARPANEMSCALMRHSNGIEKEKKSIAIPVCRSQSSRTKNFGVASWRDEYFRIAVSIPIRYFSQAENKRLWHLCERAVCSQPSSSIFALRNESQIYIMSFDWSGLCVQPIAIYESFQYSRMTGAAYRFYFILFDVCMSHFVISSCNQYAKMCVRVPECITHLMDDACRWLNNFLDISKRSTSICFM